MPRGLRGDPSAAAVRGAASAPLLAHAPAQCLAAAHRRCPSLRRWLVRSRLASTYPSPWRPLQCVCRPWPERDVAALALGSLCMPGMRAGGGHALSAGAVVVAELRRRSPAGERWWDETAAAACAAADVNRDALLDAAEMVALCMGVGPAWTEARVLDLFRGCL